jgi:hypothetical protein
MSDPVDSVAASLKASVDVQHENLLEEAMNQLERDHMKFQAFSDEKREEIKTLSSQVISLEVERNGTCDGLAPEFAVFA